MGGQPLECLLCCATLAEDEALFELNRLQDYLTNSKHSFTVVRNDDSPVLSRSFFKTEWTKPKFDVNKPLTASRDDADDVAVDNILEDVNNEIASNEKQPYKKANKLTSEAISAKFSKASSNKIMTNHCLIKNAPTQIGMSNLERLLIPPMASVSYVLIRHHSNENDDDVFWRPFVRIPDENEWRRKMKDPALRKEAERETRYLLLNFGSTRVMPKKNPNLKPKNQKSSAIKS